MLKVVLLGSGNLASHLYKVLNESKKLELLQVYARNNKALLEFTSEVETTTTLSKLKEADMYIIAVADDAISKLSDEIPFRNQLVVHTSGGVHMDVLSSKNRKGVFYPLQTFSKNRPVDFLKIPICIEAENSSDRKTIRNLGACISKKVVEITSEERAKLHLSAVFVSNFANHMYYLGNELLEKDELPFDLLKPLIAETARKIEDLAPFEAQTGPAKRNDKNTIEKHLHLLLDSSHANLYKELTKSIHTIYGKKL